MSQFLDFEAEESEGHATDCSEDGDMEVMIDGEWAHTLASAWIKHGWIFPLQVSADDWKKKLVGFLDLSGGGAKELVIAEVMAIMKV